MEKYGVWQTSKCISLIHLHRFGESIFGFRFSSAHFSIFSRFTNAHPCVTECYWHFFLFFPLFPLIVLRFGCYLKSCSHSYAKLPLRFRYGRSMIGTKLEANLEILPKQRANEIKSGHGKMERRKRHLFVNRALTSSSFFFFWYQ